MKPILKALFISMLISSTAYASITLSSISDKYCGSFFSGSFSDNGGRTWKDIKPKRICKISKDYIKFAGSTAQSISTVKKETIDGIDRIIINGNSSSTYIISEAEQYYMIITIIDGKELVRFLCLKE